MMSFTNFIFLGVFLLPLIYAEDVTLPFGNYTPQYDKRPGPCPTVSAPYLMATNMSLYAGRWFATHMGETEQIMRTFSCAYADTVFAEDGTMTTYVVHDRNGVEELAKVIWNPVPGKQGHYTFQPDENTTFHSMFFYTDAEINIYQYVVCLKDQDYHYANVVVNMLKLEYRQEKAKELERVMNVLADRGVPTPIYAIKFNKHCKYLPLDWYENL